MRFLKKFGLRGKIYLSFLLIVFIMLASIALTLPPIKKSFEKTIKKEIQTNTLLVGNMAGKLLNESIKQYLKGVTDADMRIVEKIYNKYRNKELTLEQAQNFSKSFINAQQIGEAGFTLIITPENRITKSLTMQMEQCAKEFSPAFINKLLTQKEGYLRLAKSKESLSKDDIAYLSYFAPWKWTVCAISNQIGIHSIIDLANFRKIITDADLSPSAGSYVAIFELDGRLLRHPFLTNENTLDLQDPKTKRFFLREVVDSIKAKGLQHVKSGWIEYNFTIRETPDTYGAKTLYYVYQPENKWCVVTVINKKDLLRPYTKLIRDVRIVVAVMLFSVILLAFLSSNSLVKRISALKNAARKLSENDFDISLKKHANDEIGELEEAFSDASEKISSLTLSQKKLNENLERIVEERTDALHLALQKAESATKAKSEFLANMSHEIRTPINAITGLTYLMQQQDTPPKQKRYITKIEIATQSLSGIIDDILDYSKIEAGKLDLENTTFYLHDVMEKVSTIVGMKAADKELDFIVSYEPDVPMAYSGDPLRLAQIITNLTNNAIKFTEKGEVGVYITRVQKNHIRFEVRDTGIGLTKEEASRLFRSFSQADTSTTRKYGGTGLGLAISKQLVQLMGGYIWVKSEKDKGTSFFFTVRLKEISSRNNDQTMFTNKRVLIVDDSPSWQTSLTNLLSVYNFDIEVVSSGEEALQNIKENPPYDLILMDWNMPGLNGIETTEKLNATLPSPAHPIIMISGYDEEYYKEEAARHGITTFLHKPVNPSELYNIIISYFGSEVKEDISTKVKKVSLKEELVTRKGSHILLVEDNNLNREIIKDILVHSGIIIDEAHDGLEAVEKLAQHPDRYELIFMDIQMPVMDGYTATAKIRATGSKIPIVALTANAMASDVARSKEAGMDSHLNKPIDVEKFFATLLRYLSPKIDLKEDVSDYVEPQEQVTFKFTAIDAETGLKYMNGNLALYYKILRNFQSNYEDAHNSLKKLLTENKKEAKRLLHTLKGVSASIGANDLHSVTKKLEASFDSSLLSTFDQELGKVLKDISNCPELQQEEVPHSDLPLLGGNIRKKLWLSLYEAVNSKRPKNIKRVLTKFTLYSLQHEDEQRLKEIRALLDKYKYNDALNLLGESNE
ncbi:response regulator [Halodesulfovibrio aestuarii]|uniref:response regulator n=1 Tax=Halodesulfovibrio aestuarii TaxID=126333 RepID=UPI00351FB431